MTIVLRPRQVQAIADTRLVISQGKRAPCLIAPTGAGKTIIGAGFIQGVIAKDRRALFLAHREELITQAHGKLNEFGIRAGIIKSGYPLELFRPIQVASVQTLVRRLGKIDFKPDLVMIDEAHLSNAASYKTIVAHYGNPLLIGLTATPRRLDGSGLGKDYGGMFDHLVIAGTTRELIEEGLLCKYRYYAPSLIDTGEVHTLAGEFKADELEALTDKASITGDVLEHWKRLAVGRPTMVFTVSVAHAEHVVEQARQAGYRAAAVSGDTDKLTRSNAVRDVQAGALDMVVNCALFVEGLDAPALSCLVDLSATKSISRYRQKIGRVLRIHPGKQDAVILDHVGNCERHGFPDSHIEWTLESIKKQRECAAPVRICPVCFAAHPPMAVCPACGHIYASDPTEREGPEHIPGELQEVTPELAKRIEAKRLRMEVGMAKTREELERIARERGYASSWVDIQWGFKKKQNAAKYAKQKNQLEFYADLMRR